MYQVEQYIKAAVSVDSRLLASALLPTTAVLSPGVSKGQYLERIRAPINYDGMSALEDGLELGVWQRLRDLERHDTQICKWVQTYTNMDSEPLVAYSVWLVLMLGTEWPYQNPPTSPERVFFIYLVRDDAIDLESIPNVVADASLATLPYVGLGMPTWGWAILAAVGIVGAVALVKAAR